MLRAGPAGRASENRHRQSRYRHARHCARHVPRGHPPAARIRPGQRAAAHRPAAQRQPAGQPAPGRQCPAHGLAIAGRRGPAAGARAWAAGGLHRAAGHGGQRPRAGAVHPVLPRGGHPGRAGRGSAPPHARAPDRDRAGCRAEAAHAGQRRLARGAQRAAGGPAGLPAVVLHRRVRAGLPHPALPAGTGPVRRWPLAELRPAPQPGRDGGGAGAPRLGRRTDPDLRHRHAAGPPARPCSPAGQCAAAHPRHARQHPWRGPSPGWRPTWTSPIPCPGWPKPPP